MAFKDSDISYSELIFLATLSENEGINQEGLSAMLFVDKAATARSIKLLEAKELLIRIASKEDKRAKSLYLTDKGRECNKNFDVCVREWEDFITEGLCKEDVDIIMNGTKFMGERAAMLLSLNYANVKDNIL